MSRIQARDREIVDHAAVLHQVEAVGDLRAKRKFCSTSRMVMPRLFSVHEHLADALDDHRRQAFGRLVEQQQLDAGAQDAGDRQHLLLAARQLGALARAALLQVGEQSR